MSEEDNIHHWAHHLEDEIAKCYNTFQERGDKVYDASKELTIKSPMGAIQSLNICMQIEAEFPGRLEECLERADMVANFSGCGIMNGLISAIRYMRIH